jgi:hypothetical protein
MKNSDLKIILKNGIAILRHMGANEKLVEKHLKLVPTHDSSFHGTTHANPNFYWGVGEDGKKLQQDEYLTSYMFVLKQFLDKTEEHRDNYIWTHDSPSGNGFYSNVFDYDPIFEKVGVDVGLMIIDYIGDKFNEELD